LSEELACVRACMSAFESVMALVVVRVGGALEKRRLEAGATDAERLSEAGLEDLGAVVEDAADVGSYEEGVDEGAAEDGVVDVIGD
jgi:hypothetical protein